MILEFDKENRTFKIIDKKPDINNGIFLLYFPENKDKSDFFRVKSKVIDCIESMLTEKEINKHIYILAYHLLEGKKLYYGNIVRRNNVSQETSLFECERDIVNPGEKPLIRFNQRRDF